MNRAFEDLKLSDYMNINGGAVGGAVVGWIIGGAVGLGVYSGKIVFSRNATTNGIWKSYTAGAFAGLGIGTVAPF